MICEIGDVIAVPGILGTFHVGVYVGPRSIDGKDVLHNDKASCVQLVKLSEFAAGRPILILHRVAEREKREIVAQRGLQLVGVRYDLLRFNCEHAAYYALTGQARSPQLERALATLAVVAAIAVFLSLTA